MPDIIQQDSSLNPKYSLLFDFRQEINSVLRLEQSQDGFNNAEFCAMLLSAMLPLSASSLDSIVEVFHEIDTGVYDMYGESLSQLSSIFQKYVARFKESFGSDYSLLRDEIQTYIKELRQSDNVLRKKRFDELNKKFSLDNPFPNQNDITNPFAFMHESPRYRPQGQNLATIVFP